MIIIMTRGTAMTMATGMNTVMITRTITRMTMAIPMITTIIPIRMPTIRMVRGRWKRRKAER